MCARFVALLAAPLMAGCSVVGIRSVEEHPYAVASRDGDFEIRSYEAAIVAETRADEGDYDADVSAGFRRLFDYITGANASDTAIEMTAPVVIEPVDGSAADDGEEIPMTAPVLIEKGEAGRTVTFVMPAAFTWVARA